MIEKSIAVLMFLVFSIAFIYTVFTQMGAAIGGEYNKPNTPSLKKEVVKTMTEILPK
ncbi:hypothetical protein [Brevibacillus massiliensis]|uniref:hypothetical protein n=1 Tax=Brevibacillus massiliensis TaxID=1118054 RepID=UPI0002DAD451|nr:hypothetical protein [Brevibacillus massiliensis]